jgi:hypothetical protein
MRSAQLDLLSDKVVESARSWLWNQLVAVVVAAVEPRRHELMPCNTFFCRALAVRKSHQRGAK